MRNPFRTKRMAIVVGACALVAVAGSGTVVALGASGDVGSEPPTVGNGIGGGMRDVAGEKVPDSYIVVLRDDVPKNVVSPTAAELVKQYGGEVKHTYDATIAGFSIHATAQQAEDLSKDSRVAYVEPNQRMRISGS
jgi:hypothetical protein